MEAERKAMAVERAEMEAERKAMDAQKAGNLDQARSWVERIKIERADLATERQRLGGLIKRAQAALRIVLRLAPRVRRIVQDAEVGAEARQAAREARAEIVKAVPLLRSTGSFLSDARRAGLRSPLEQAREPVLLDDGLDFDGPG